MQKTYKNTRQYSSLVQKDMAWDDAVDDLVVEILATTIKQFKKQEKFPRHDTTCAPTV